MTVSECEALRREIKPLAEKVRAMLDANPGFNDDGNTLLAYRHLEDASMRLGKAIQALNGGVSVYDKTQVPA